MADFYETFERFCIMAEADDVGEIQALKYIQEKYGRAIAVEIWQKYCKGESNAGRFRR